MALSELLWRIKNYQLLLTYYFDSAVGGYGEINSPRAYDSVFVYSSLLRLFMNSQKQLDSLSTCILNP